MHWGVTAVFSWSHVCARWAGWDWIMDQGMVGHAQRAVINPKVNESHLDWASDYRDMDQHCVCSSIL